MTPRLGQFVVVTSWGPRTGVPGYDTATKAQRDAHRWLRRSAAEDGEWVTILLGATGEVSKRYMRRDGRVVRMQ